MAQPNLTLLEAKTSSNIDFLFLLFPLPWLACGHGDWSLSPPLKQDSNVEMEATANASFAAEGKRQSKTDVLARST